MRLAVLATLVVSTSVAHAAPDWTDVPAMLDAAVAPQADALRACLTKFSRPLPHRFGLQVTRSKDGTRVALPMPPVGIRGIPPDHRCLAPVVATIALPPLPAGLDEVWLAYTLVAAGAPAAPIEKRFVDWRDPGAVLGALLDEPHRAALAACDAAPRTVRVVVDRRGERTRIWLPAWQFHAADGSGTTPPRQAKVKACLTAALRGWSLPVLPLAMGELHLRVEVGR